MLSYGNCKHFHPSTARTHTHTSWHILLITKVKKKKKKKKITAAVLIANIFWFMSGYTQVNTDKSCVRFSYTALLLQHQS